MGWRTDGAYERTREAEERRWIASLAPRDRLRVRVWQGWRTALLVLVGLATLYGFLLGPHLLPAG